MKHSQRARGQGDRSMLLADDQSLAFSSDLGVTWVCFRYHDNTTAPESRAFTHESQIQLCFRHWAPAALIREILTLIFLKYAKEECACSYVRLNTTDNRTITELPPPHRAYHPDSGFLFVCWWLYWLPHTKVTSNQWIEEQWKWRAFTMVTSELIYFIDWHCPLFYCEYA